MKANSRKSHLRASDRDDRPLSENGRAPVRRLGSPKAKRPSLRAILAPFAGAGHRRASADVHQYLRTLILSNVIAPETILSQVEVGDCLKVSRTPVREALRMLQEEGLVRAEPNYRCRVLGFNPQELEALYVSRIANEGISALATVNTMTDADLKQLSDVLKELHRSERNSSFTTWIRHHRLFHQMLFAGANPALRERMAADYERSERYVYNAMQSGLTDMFHRAAVEHQEILEACRRRQSALVVRILTDHLARAGMDILAELAPYWEPTTLRTAARLILSGAEQLEQADRPKKRITARPDRGTRLSALGGPG